jgi:hypothetical protein
MSTHRLLEQASDFSKRHDDSEAARCIDALIWRLRADEEWIVSQRRREPTGTNGLVEALRIYSKRLGEISSQYSLGSGADASEMAVNCFNALLKALSKADLLSPGTRCELSGWFLAETEGTR